MESNLIKGICELRARTVDSWIWSGETDCLDEKRRLKVDYVDEMRLRFERPALNAEYFQLVVVVENGVVNYVKPKVSYVSKIVFL
jgi:hypothetical protein